MLWHRNKVYGQCYTLLFSARRGCILACNLQVTSCVCVTVCMCMRVATVCVCVCMRVATVCVCVCVCLRAHTHFIHRSVSANAEIF